jgi:hypothetical protein
VGTSPRHALNPVRCPHSQLVDSEIFANGIGIWYQPNRVEEGFLDALPCFCYLAKNPPVFPAHDDPSRQGS